MRLTSRADEHAVNLKWTPQCRPAGVSTSVTELSQQHACTGASATPAGGFRNLREIQQPRMLLLTARLNVFPPEFRGCFIKGGAAQPAVHFCRLQLTDSFLFHSRTKLKRKTWNKIRTPFRERRLDVPRAGRSWASTSNSPAFRFQPPAGALRWHQRGHEGPSEAPVWF